MLQKIAAAATSLLMKRIRYYIWYIRDERLDKNYNQISAN